MSNPESGVSEQCRALLSGLVVLVLAVVVVETAPHVRLAIPAPEPGETYRVDRFIVAVCFAAVVTTGLCLVMKVDALRIRRSVYRCVAIAHGVVGLGAAASIIVAPSSAPSAFHPASTALLVASVVAVVHSLRLAGIPHPEEEEM